MLIPTLFLYRDPPQPENTKTIRGCPQGRGDGPRRRAVHADDLRLFGVLDPLFPEFRAGSLVPPRLHRPSPRERPLRFDRHQPAVRCGARHRDQCGNDHPASGLRQPDRQERHAPANDDRRNGDRRPRIPLPRLRIQRLDLHPGHRRLFDRRDDRSPEVLQLHRPRGPGGQEGGLHGICVPVRRHREPDRFDAGRLPVRNLSQAPRRLSRSCRGDTEFLARLCTPGRCRGGGSGGVQQVLFGRHAGQQPPCGEGDAGDLRGCPAGRCLHRIFHPDGRRTGILPDTGPGGDHGGPRRAGSHSDPPEGPRTHTLTYFDASAEQIGHFSGGFPNSMCPQTGQSQNSPTFRSFPFLTASSAIV